MCGIVGYVGGGHVAEVLLSGLKRLEYRGYDSAGMALQYQDRIESIKVSGKVRDLREKVSSVWGEGTCGHTIAGIAHTRWATHGAPTESNAHPHLSQNGDVALVHNGIIENYKSIRARLEKQGVTFRSETDSETLAHLIDTCYEGDLVKAVCTALQQVQGTFGIAVLSRHEPGRLVAARRGSPIVIGVGEKEIIVASDATPVLPYTRQVIYLDDDDVAAIEVNRVDICDLTTAPVSRTLLGLDWDEGAAEKDGYEHFMLKEIFEQPETLRNTIRGRLDHDQGSAVLSGLNLAPRDIAQIKRVLMVGCGTSMHAGMVGEYAFEDLADLPAEVEQAAEFRYRNPIVNHSDLILAISQSGETADTLAAVREGLRKGALVAALCNVVGSTIARETGRGVYLHAGPEIGVASTKAFTSQVTVLLMAALKFARSRRLTRQAGIEICAEIERLPEIVATALLQSDRIKAVAEKYCSCEHFFFIGRGYLFPVALEGALKLKEISYIHAEGYHAAELKHGPIALLEPSTPVVALLNDVPGKEKTIGNAEECRARSAPVIGVITEGDSDSAGVVDEAIYVPRTSPFLAPLPSVIIMQLLAYHIARLRGCSIDQPRNLAKSVTVE